MSTATQSKTATVIDRKTFTITFTRVYPASREHVFAAWTEPDQIQHWWDPSGARLAKCVVDLRPGGAFEFTNRDSAHSPPFAGTYRTIERPARLVFDALGSVGTVTLEDAGDTTHMTVTIRCGSAEHLDQFIKLGVDEGTDRTLDNLGAYLKKAAR